MGAEFNTATIPVAKVTKTNPLSKIFNEIISDCRWASGHGGYSGTFAECSDLAISNKKFNTLQEAYNYLEETHEKWEPAIAVLAKNDKGDEFWVIGAWCSS